MQCRFIGQGAQAVCTIMGQVANGMDPAAERRKAAVVVHKKSYRLSDLLEDWSSLHLAGRSDRYAVDALLTLRRVFESHLGMAAADLDRAAVVRAVDALVRKGRSAMARQVAAYGRAAYGWGVKRGSVATNPFITLPLPPAASRDRVLTDSELVAIWQATDGAGAFNSIVRILLLTGQRLNEVAAMTWTELSDDLSTWTIPASRTKNDKINMVPASEPAQKILRATPQSGAFVFPGYRGPFRGFARAKAALDASSGVTEWRLHDLRRTAATGLQRLGVRLETTESILNHVSGSRSGIVGVYQRHDFAAEKRTALDAWAEHVAAIVEGRAATSNVTELRSSRG